MRRKLWGSIITISIHSERNFGQKAKYIRCCSQSSRVVNSTTQPKSTKWKNINQSESAMLQNDCISISIHGKDFSFPSVWLRDNCTCEKCFHPPSQSRIINWCEFDINVAPVAMITLENELKIEWSDGHHSQFSFQWLLERSFHVDDQEKYLNRFYRPNKIVWDKNDSSELFKKYSYTDILENDQLLKNWLYRLSVHGVAFLDGVPPSVDSSRHLANRIGFIRKTHYGEEYEVKADPKDQAVNVAYLSHNLQLHSDLPYYEYKPGVTILHYIEQAKGDGAENILSDMHKVVKIIKEKNPEDYKILTEVLVDWTDVGEQNGNKFYSIYRSPVIVEDKEGNVIRINHSIPQRGSHFNIQINKVTLWYKALHNLVQLLYKEGYYFKPTPGTILAFDNIRLVHGRTKYKDEQGNSRFLIGCYVDWDEVYSRLRCLIKST